MDLIFGYLAGLLTLINPCVLPVIPIALASAVADGRRGPVLLAGGMSLSFTLLGLLTASVGPAIGLSVESVSRAGAVMMVLFGLVLVVPRFNATFATAAAGLANSATHRLASAESGGAAGQFLGGALLGAVWAPCIGPTLGGAIALASQGADIGWAAAVMVAFSLGVSTVILALAYGTRQAIGARRRNLQTFAEWSKPLMGIAFLTIGIALLFGLQDRAAGALLDIMPLWLQDLSVSI